MQIPVVVVTTNRANHVRTWLEAVTNLQTDGFEILPCIVDNASSDGTPGLIWEAIKDGRINPKNVFWLHKSHWFVSAQNYAFRVLGARGYSFIATLNEDAVPEKGWLRALVTEARKNSQVGMFGGVIRCTHDESRISSAGHCLRPRDGAFLDIDYNEASDQATESAMVGFEPFAPCFAASLWSFEMIAKVGLPDNEQFIYYDDVELAFKARLLNWSGRFVPQAVAQHPLPRKSNSGERLFAQVRGRLALVAKYFPWSERQRILNDFLTDPAAQRNKWFQQVAHDTQQFMPFGSEGDRRRIFDAWADRHVPNHRR